MSQYATGTVTTTAGSTTVTGSGTAWLANVSVGDEIIIGDEGYRNEVALVGSDTSITLVTAFPVTLYDESYAIVSDFTYNRSYPLANQGDAHGADILRRAIQMIDADMQFQLTFGGTVLDMLNAAPTSGVNVGDRYIVDSGVTPGDDWEGYEQYLATYTGTSGAEWDFEQPTDGLFVLDQDSTNLYLYSSDDDDWIIWGLSVDSCDGDFTINDGDLYIKTGSNTRVRLGSTNVFNEYSEDIDFRVESNGNANMLFVDAGNDRVGIGTNAPDTTHHIMASDASATTNASAPLTVERNGTCYIQILTPAANVGGVLFGDPGDDDIGKIIYNHSTDVMELNAAAGKKISFGSGSVVINEDSADVDFRVESDGNIFGLVVDAGLNRIGIMQAAGDNTLELTGTFGIGTGSSTTGKINVDAAADQYTAVMLTNSGGSGTHRSFSVPIMHEMTGSGPDTVWTYDMSGAAAQLHVLSISATIVVTGLGGSPNYGKWTTSAFYRCDGTTATEITDTTTADAGNNASTAAPAFSVSGDDIRLSILGLNAVTTYWTGKIEVVEVY